MPRTLSLVQAGLMVSASLCRPPRRRSRRGPDGPPPAAAAQPRPPGQPQPPSQARQHAQVHRFIERFQVANTTGDGRLTLAQAQAGGMPMVVRRFDAIDVQHKGYVTLQDIRAYRQQMRAMRDRGDGTTD